jgi:hypothetical protein
VELVAQEQGEMKVVVDERVRGVVAIEDSRRALR